MGVFRNAPPGYLRAQFQRQLLPGAVIKLEELMDDGKVHEKRFVVVSVDSNGHTVCFVINSVIGQFIQARPNMLKCQAPMDVASHPFMSWDSHVDCYAPHVYTTAHVLDELVNGTGSLLGKITLPMRDEVVKKLLLSAVTSPQEKTGFSMALATMT
jgi:hypothetical protein